MVFCANATVLFSFVSFESQGNQTTGGCCSKCWSSIRKDKSPDSGSVATSSTEATQLETPMEADLMSVDVKPTPMETETTPAASSPVENPPPAAATTTKKKKKKKQSYKNMMASMMNSNGESRDSEKEKNELRKVTGGGAFSKIDKI